MSYDCYCDYDPPKFYQSRIVKARKPHVCDECRRPIGQGESHEYAFGTYGGGESYSSRTCNHCLAIRQFVAGNVPCFCWAHGHMLEDAKECVQEAYFRAADEVRGLAVGYLRRVIAGQRASR